MRRYITDPQSQKQEEVIMYVENKNVPLTDLGGGVVRKVLAYSENLMNVELKFEKEPSAPNTAILMSRSAISSRVPCYFRRRERKIKFW